MNLRGQVQRGPLFHPQPLVFCGQFGAGAAHARVRVNPRAGAVQGGHLILEWAFCLSSCGVYTRGPPAKTVGYQAWHVMACMAGISPPRFIRAIRLDQVAPSRSSATKFLTNNFFLLLLSKGEAWHAHALKW